MRLQAAAMDWRPPIIRMRVLVLAGLMLVHCSGGASRFDVRPCHSVGNEVSCSGSHLSEVPAFATINGANIVDLSKNDILVVGAAAFRWHGTETLQHLLLHTNTIVHVDAAAFRTLYNLELVDLSNNELESVAEDLVRHNARMHELRLAQNRLRRSVPRLRSDSLQVLDLSWNQLDALPPGALDDLINLRQLRLQNNNFRHIDPARLLALVALERVDLQINPWPCTCDAQRLFEFVVTRRLFASAAPVLCGASDHDLVLVDEVAGVSSQFCKSDEDFTTTPAAVDNDNGTAVSSDRTPTTRTRIYSAWYVAVIVGNTVLLTAMVWFLVKMVRFGVIIYRMRFASKQSQDRVYYEAVDNDKV